MVSVKSTKGASFSFLSIPHPSLPHREPVSQCIIRRVCGLLSPSVPIELQPTVYSLCLTCLRNFITGPGLTPPLSVHLDENNIWSQHSSFTRHVVESEGVPHRLLSILDQFYLDQNSYLLTTSFSVDPLSVDLIVHLLRCLSAFCEENTGCLEGMLRIGARAKVMRLLSNEQFFQLPVLRSGLGCLAVLCGYSHMFQRGGSGHDGPEVVVSDSSGEPTHANLIPSALCLEARELFELLTLVSSLLTRFIGLSSASGDFDAHVTLNFGIICRYLLPLCSPQDPLYLSILPNLLHLFHHQWTLANLHQLNALLALDSCLLELMLSSRELCEQIWNTTHVSLVLFNQMEYASTTLPSSPILSSQISHLCIQFYSCLLSYGLTSTFNSHKNHSFHKLCIHMLSRYSAEGEPNYTLLDYLLTTLISSSASPSLSLTPLLLSFDLLDHLFTLLIKFKHHSHVYSEIFQTTQRGTVSSLYNIQSTRHLALKLIEFLMTSPDSTVQYVKIDHIERVQQLHQIILTELKKGHLGLTVELQQMTETVLDLLKLILEFYQRLLVPQSEPQKEGQRQQVLRECEELVGRWNTDLNAAHLEGMQAGHPDMEIMAQTSIMPLLPNSKYTTGSLIIVAVPLWETGNSLSQYSVYATVYVPADLLLNRLINGLCVMCQMNVSVSFLFPQTNALTSLTTQEQYLQLCSHLQQHGVTYGPHLVMTLFLTHTAAPSAQSSPRSSTAFNTISMSAYQNPFESNAYQLKQKDVTLKNLQRSLQSQGKPFNMELMSLFYDYIRDCQSDSSSGSFSSQEITQDQFVAALTSEHLNYSPQFASDIFRSFDTDHNGTLSLTEISIGFAKLMNSNYDERLELIFKAYDRDHNGVLDLEELIDMIRVATGLPLDQARQYAITVGNAVDENGSNTIEFDEFKEAVYQKLIPLEMSWSDSFAQGVGLGSGRQPTRPQQRLWKQSNAVIQSTAAAAAKIFQPKRSQSDGFAALKSPSRPAGAQGASSGFMGKPIRRAFSADFNSEGYDDQEGSFFDHSDSVLGIGMSAEDKEGLVYVRRRVEDERDELESKFLNRKQRSHSASANESSNKVVAFEDESTFSPHGRATVSASGSLNQLQALSSEDHFPHHPNSLSSVPEHDGAGSCDETDDFVRPPTPILSITKRNSELNQPPLSLREDISPGVASTAAQSPSIPSSSSPAEEGPKKRSNTEISKASLPSLPTPPGGERSAIRESKVKDIKKNPFSKSPK
jgi:Ca2+-binding EF-hand superfamily protein